MQEMAMAPNKSIVMPDPIATLRSFALHHRAVEEKKLNEGVLLRDIQAALGKE
jgi:hypothetical protein